MPKGMLTSKFHDDSKSYVRFDHLSGPGPSCPEFPVLAGLGFAAPSLMDGMCFCSSTLECSGSAPRAIRIGSFARSGISWRPVSPSPYPRSDEAMIAHGDPGGHADGKRARWSGCIRGRRRVLKKSVLERGGSAQFIFARKSITRRLPTMPCASDINYGQLASPPSGYSSTNHRPAISKQRSRSGWPECSR